MPQPEVKQYPKSHLRAILANPEIDTSSKLKLDSADKLSNRHFYAQVNPVIKKHCEKIISLPEFKKCRIVSAKVVKIIFEKLL